MTGKFRQSHFILSVLGLGILLLLSFILFSIYQQPIYIWDEAIYANNSLEMAQHHQYLTYTNNGLTDHYNSKPPLVLWLQSISFLLFSFSEFALRLPTFLGLLGILFLFLRYVNALNLSPAIFMISSFIFLTTKGAIRQHVFLSGDLDGILVFFTTALFFIQLNQVREKRISNQSIILSALCLLGGYFTKSTAIFLIMPSLIAGIWFAQLLKSLLKKKMLYASLFVFLSIAALYYVIREHADPGYMQVVWDSEFKRYISKVMSWQVQPFFYYFENILIRLNPYYSIITILAAIPYALLRDMHHRRLVLHLFIFCIIYLIVISIPATKLEWYDAPIYPVWAFGLSIMLYELYVWLKIKISISTISTTLVTMLICLFAGFLVWRICIDLSGKRVYQPQEEEAAVLKQLDQTYHHASYTVLMDVEENKLHHFDALNFYVKSFQLNEQKTVFLKRTLAEVRTHDTLIVVQTNKIDSLRSLFSIKQIKDNYLVVLERK